MNADSKGEYEGKTILFVNSGSRKKEFTLAVAKKLGLKIALVNKTCTWQKKYIDHFIQADTYVHNEVVTKLKEFMDKNEISGAVTFWEDDVPLLARICDEFNFIGPSMETAEKARNKHSMREAFFRGNVPAPRFYLIRPGNGDLKKAIEHVGFPAVIKPCWGSDSEFVIKVNDEKEADETYQFMLKNAVPKFNPIFKYNDSHFLMEEYMPGAEVNVESLTQNGQTHIISLSDKMPMDEPYFLERGDYIPSRYTGEMLGRIKEVVRAAHRAVGAQNCVSHTEVKLTPEGPKVVEIAVRMGGDYLWDWVKTVWDVDLVEQGIRIALGLPLNFKIAPEPKTYLTGRYFIPGHSGVVSNITFRGDVHSDPAVKTIKIHKKVGDPVLVPPLGFENTGWMITKGSSAVESELRLNELMDKVSVNVLEFSSTSSIGQSKRKNALSTASVETTKIIRGAKIEKIRLISELNIPKLHVGLLMNRYDNPENEFEKDAMETALHIQKALESKGHTVTLFDMNSYPLPIQEIQTSGVDIIFNICEEINNVPMLEPHAVALLDILGIPYTGSNSQTIALCRDKIRMKKLLDFHQIPTPKWDYAYNVDEEIDDTLRYPLIVKPANTDNSVGVSNSSVVDDAEGLKRELKKVIIEQGRPALVEEYIEGDEYDVSIIGNDNNITVLPLTRSIFDGMPKEYRHVYAFEAMWTSGGNSAPYDAIVDETPAKIQKKLASLITEIAIDTYNLLDAHDYGRVEIRVDKEGNPYVIGLNVNPYIGKGDFLADAAKLINIDSASLVEKVLWLAVKRYKDNPPYYHLMTSTNI